LLHAPGVVVAGRTPEGVLGLEDGVGDEPLGMFVLQTVENPCSVLPCRDYPSKPHFRQMLGHCRRRFVDHFRQLMHRQFTVPEGKDDSDARRVGQHREDLNREFHELAVGFSSANLHICIHSHILAQAPSFPHAAAAGRRRRPQPVL
jgi:hypothetical protein